MSWPVAERASTRSNCAASFSVGTSFSSEAMTTWTLGRICVRSPLPSLVTMMEVPVSAIRKFAPVTPMSALRNFSRKMPRASASSCSGCERSRPAGRSRCALRKSASTSSRVTWIAGAMMCEGASPRSWMMYSPRSVSIASMPSASIAALRPISSEIIDLPLVTALAPRALQRSRKIRRASAASRAKCTWPPSSVDLALVGLEIEIEMGERVVLDVAGAVAQRVELGQPSRPLRRAAARNCGRDAARAAAARRPAPRGRFP